jgi:plastocyanin
LVDVGQTGFDTMGTKTAPGDSIYLAPKATVSFKVTAKKGSELHYFCAIHPWMQGTITVK